jgi:hypothetical protein
MRLEKTMKRSERKAERADFLRILAIELDSHAANGSGFIFQTRDGEDAPEEVVKLRLAILERVVGWLERKADQP